VIVGGLLVLAYLLGAVPASQLAARAAGVDLTRRGSGNLGATNVYRVVGWKAALPVLLYDIGKGFVPTWFFPLWDGHGAAAWALGYGTAAILGHVASVFAGFRGGKGVATSCGVLLALAPLAVLVAGLVWAGTVALTRVVSLGSLAAATTIPILAWLGASPARTVAYATGLSALVWWTHRGNLRRLFRGEEHRFGTAAARRDAREEAPEAGPEEAP